MCAQNGQKNKNVIETHERNVNKQTKHNGTFTYMVYLWYE